LFGVYAIFESGHSTHARGAADIDLQDNARSGLEEMARLIRMAGYDPAGSGIFGFQSAGGFTALATDSRLVFSVDADEDGVIDANSSERIGFALFGTELKRTMDGVAADAGAPLAKSVQSMRISYFTAAGTPLPNPPGATYTLTASERALIRRIQVSVTLSGTASSGFGPQSRVYTLTTDLRPRNL
jgi:hypothetical protein